MDYLLDLLQGLGIAAAIGIRPFLPALLVGALAADNLGLDFGGTDFSFLESTGFLLAMLVLVAVFGLVERRTDTSRGVTAAVLGVIALALGALESAGSVADHSDDWWPGAIVGLAAAALAFYVTRSLLARVRPRLERQGVSGTLPLYVEGGALLAAGLSVLLPPLSIVLVAVLVWLLVGGRRRAGEKYAGLRILR